ncbi:hypothetical protein V6N13_051950 [Hibiscus sabdariffa]|uniref:Uncharacterized protein n=1 Tax=Hibiscus sabdariffa TaxID=183260 RepID=A0ABR2T4Z8_9ROSI
MGHFYGKSHVKVAGCICCLQQKLYESMSRVFQFYRSKAMLLCSLPMVKFGHGLARNLESLSRIKLSQLTVSVTHFWRGHMSAVTMHDFTTANQLKFGKKSKFNLSDGEEDEFDAPDFGSLPERDDFEDEMLSDDDNEADEKRPAILKQFNAQGAQSMSEGGLVEGEENVRPIFH